MKWAVAVVATLLVCGSEGVKNKDFTEKAELFSSECN